MKIKLRNYLIFSIVILATTLSRPAIPNIFPILITFLSIILAFIIMAISIIYTSSVLVVDNKRLKIFKEQSTRLVENIFMLLFFAISAFLGDFGPLKITLLKCVLYIHIYTFILYMCFLCVMYDTFNYVNSFFIICRSKYYTDNKIKNDKK